jgi:hypothetical protein
MDTEPNLAESDRWIRSPDGLRRDAKIDPDLEAPDFCFVSEKEAKLLMMATVLGGGAQGATQETIERVLEWAELVRIHAAMLAVVLSGEATIGFRALGEIELTRIDDENVKRRLREAAEAEHHTRR